MEKTPFLLENNIGERHFEKYDTENDFKHAIVSSYGYDYKIPDFKKQLIIFTSRMDFEIDLLGPNLIASGIDYLRINVEDILDGKYEFAIKIIENELDIQVFENGQEFKICKFNHIWFRHFYVKQSDFDNVENEYISTEWNEFFASVAQLYPEKMLTPAIEDNILTKPYQLKEAVKAGFLIPETFVTNSIKILKDDKISKSKMFAKAVRHHSIHQNHQVFDFYAKVILPDDLPDQESFGIAPIIAQNDLYDSNRQEEYRVTIFGDYIFAHKYTNVMSEDWHNDEISNVDLIREELPFEIKTKISNYTKKLNLVFSTIDLLKIDDDWYFLEINPNGDWAWLESRTGDKITNFAVKAILALE